jgi:hypothetical protein
MVEKCCLISSRLYIEFILWKKGFSLKSGETRAWLRRKKDVVDSILRNLWILSWKACLIKASIGLSADWIVDEWTSLIVRLLRDLVILIFNTPAVIRGRSRAVARKVFYIISTRSRRRYIRNNLVVSYWEAWKLNSCVISGFGTLPFLNRI